MWGQIKDYLGDYRFKFRKRNSNHSLLCKFEFLTTKYPILNGGASGALEERSIHFTHIENHVESSRDKMKVL